jgi:hypothetical protein
MLFYIYENLLAIGFYGENHLEESAKYYLKTIQKGSDDVKFAYANFLLD